MPTMSLDEPGKIIVEFKRGKKGDPVAFIYLHNGEKKIAFPPRGTTVQIGECWVVQIMGCHPTKWNIYSIKLLQRYKGEELIGYGSEHHICNKYGDEKIMAHPYWCDVHFDIYRSRIRHKFTIDESKKRVVVVGPEPTNEDEKRYLEDQVLRDKIEALEKHLRHIEEELQKQEFEIFHSIEITFRSYTEKNSYGEIEGRIEARRPKKDNTYILEVYDTKALLEGSQSAEAFIKANFLRWKTTVGEKAYQDNSSFDDEITQYGHFIDEY